MASQARQQAMRILEGRIAWAEGKDVKKVLDDLNARADGLEAADE